ncbi:hypothetical protein [Micromonospora sp. NPDC005174]|uniref:hypothetical protein n=1 Tax=unclassified Micromonospora TaxID=2617518 RepID=UPI0033BD3DBE
MSSTRCRSCGTPPDLRRRAPEGQEVELAVCALPPLDPPDDDEDDPDGEEPDDEDDPEDDDPESPPEDEVEVESDLAGLLAVPPADVSEPDARESVR